MIALLVAAALASCPEEVARRADLMAADIDTMPHVVKEGLRQLAYDSRVAAAATNLALCREEAAVTAQDATALCARRLEELEALVHHGDR